VPDTRATASVPWWVQVLDLCTVSVIIAGVSLFIWQGPRFALGPWMVSVRSPWRLLVWALAVGTLRHFLVLRPSLPERLWVLPVGLIRTVARWRPPSPGAAWLRVVAAVRSPDLRAVVAPFVASRGVVLLVGALAVAILGYPPDRPRPRLADNGFLNLMAKWDAEWYLDIARDGYQWDDNLRHQMRLAFLPAYPMASRLAGWLVGSVPLGAALITFGAFLGALVYLFRLAREQIGESDAHAAVLFLAFSPFAVFYSSMYTESLFLLGTVAAFYHFRRSEWVRASVWGILVGLTRPNAALLSGALAVAILEMWVRARRNGESRAVILARIRAGALAAMMPLVGTAIYSLYVYALTGDPLTWLRLHAYWGRGDATVADLASIHYGWIRKMGVIGYAAALPIDFINTCATILAIAAVWPVTRRLGPAYGFFVAANLVAGLLSGTTLSLARLTSTLFPLFLWLGTVIPLKQRPSWVAAFATCQGFVAALFFTWRRFY
jgi:hypothetical protein